MAASIAIPMQFIDIMADSTFFRIGGVALAKAAVTKMAMALSVWPLCGGDVGAEHFRPRVWRRRLEGGALPAWD